MAFDDSLRQRILDGVERFVRERVAPRAAEIDETGEFPRDLWDAAAELGLFGLGIPEEYGGLGRDLVTPLLISERIARVSAAFALTFNNSTDSVVPIVQAGSARVKRDYLPRLAAGELIPCISISEPQGGSDVAAIKTTARREGGGYVLNGRKMWCSNGPVGDLFTVFAKTDPEAGSRGLSAFVVPKDAPGFTAGRGEPLMGLRGSPVGELIFEDVPVPGDARLGEEGEGFRIAMLTLDESRLHCAATALGVATAAVEHATAYACERVQFGKPIIEHQGIQFLLAELVTELAAARALLGGGHVQVAAGAHARGQHLRRHDQAPVLGAVHEGNHRGGSGAWRQRPVQGLSGGAPDARRQGLRNLRRHQPNSERRDRPAIAEERPAL